MNGGFWKLVMYNTVDEAMENEISRRLAYKKNRKKLKKIKILIMLAHKSDHKLFKLIGKDCCKLICDLL